MLQNIVISVFLANSIDFLAYTFNETYIYVEETHVLMKWKQSLAKS